MCHFFDSGARRHFAKVKRTNANTSKHNGTYVVLYDLNITVNTGSYTTVKPYVATHPPLHQNKAIQRLDHVELVLAKP